MLPLLGYSQGNFPFPVSDAIWKNRIDIWSTVTPIELVSQIWTSYCMQATDTLINGSLYAVLDDCEGAYVAAIRDIAGQVMIVPADSTTEYLLYDTTVPDGGTDTLEVWDMAFGLETVTVFGQGPDPHGRNVVNVVSGFQWIEGIGNTAGLLAPNLVNISGAAYVLDCMSHADTIRYPWEQVGECVAYNAVAEKSDQALSVFPNPAHAVLYVEHPDDPGYFRIVDLAGRPIDEGSLIAGRNAIALDAFPPGAYALITSSKEVSRSTRFVKIAP